jgi:hypothetical protein
MICFVGQVFGDVLRKAVGQVLVPCDWAAGCYVTKYADFKTLL